MSSSRLVAALGSRTIESSQFANNTSALGDTTPVAGQFNATDAVNNNPAIVTAQSQQTQKYILYGALALGLYLFLRK